MKTVWSNVKKSLDCTSESSSDVHDPSLSSKPRNSRSRFTNICCESLEPSPINSIPKTQKSSFISNRDDHSSISSARRFPREDRVYETYSRYVQSGEYIDSPVSYEFRGYGSGYLVQGSHRNNSLRYFDSGEFPIMPQTPTYTRTGTTPKTSSLEKEGASFGRLIHGCPICRERVAELDAVCSRHAVSVNLSGEFRGVVEQICRKNWSKSEITSRPIEHVLKVCTLEKTRTQFNEYKEMVKSRANELKDEDSRRLVHGNEQRRFYGTTIACNLGMDSSTSLCGQDTCGVCRILKCGFSSEKELKNGIVGILTSCTSEKALETIKLPEENMLKKKALLVCRVIVGRVLEDLVDIADRICFDSFTEKVSKLDDIEELYSFSPKALLPCFVVILGH